MTNEQLLDAKFYAQEVYESAMLAYWARENDKAFHTRKVKDNIDELIALMQEVHNAQRA